MLMGMEEQEELEELLDMHMGFAGEELLSFCECHGYDPADHAVLDALTEAAYRNGRKWAEREADCY